MGQSALSAPSALGSFLASSGWGLLGVGRTPIGFARTVPHRPTWRWAPGLGMSRYPKLGIPPLVRSLRLIDHSAADGGEGHTRVPDLFWRNSRDIAVDDGEIGQRACR